MFKYCPLYVNGSNALIEDGDIFRITIQHNKEAGNIGIKNSNKVITSDNVGVKEQIMELIKGNEGINAKTIATHFPDIVDRTVERYIKELKDNNIIEFRGTPKTGGYYIISSR